MSFADHAARALAVLLALAAGPLAAAQIVLVNGDGGGTGFNDPSPAQPAAGDNGAATLGAQRLRVVQRAAEIWAAVLHSPVPIRALVRMPALACGDAGTTLGTGGPLTLAWNFPNAPRSGTAYPIALANALAGTDLSSGDDLQLNLNVSLDAGCSSTITGWWYGIDPQAPIPAGRVSMLAVALHELAHGLGFVSAIDAATGQYAASQPSLWANYLFDQQQGRHWRQMSAAERAASARNDPFLVWSGTHVNRQFPLLLLGEAELRIDGVRGGPRVLADLATAEFGAALDTLDTPTGVVAVNDGVAATGDVPGTATDGCEFPFANGSRLAGQVALVDRGGCAFVQKARHAQQHGAIGVLIANQVDGPAPTMAGIAPDVTIPVIGIAREAGRRLRLWLPRSVLTLQVGRGAERAGTRAGCLRMHAPAELASGSSVSHFAPAATPNLLMEPSVTASLFDDLDLTVDLFRDLGWPLLLPPPVVQPLGCAAQPLP